MKEGRVLVVISSLFPAVLWGCGTELGTSSGQGGGLSPASVPACTGHVTSRCPPRGADGAQPAGVDVSGWDGDVDWNAVVAAGQSFTYIKATEGVAYRNHYFASQYDGSFNAGLIRGSYHFARPDVSSGTAQADYFLKHGGGWSADGQTLPGVLDIEYNPYGDTCYGLGASDMAAWVHDFADEYKTRTGRAMVIYSTADWWNSCTGGSTDFGATNPLWIANYGVDSPALPAGWTSYTFWQYSDSASIGGIGGGADVNVFNGDSSGLAAFAVGM